MAGRTGPKRSDQFVELQDELDRYDAKLTPLDAELSHLREIRENTGDRITAAETDLRIGQLEDERKPLWEERLRVARRFAVVRAIEDERERRERKAEQARREIARAETKARILALMAGEVRDLFLELAPNGRVTGSLPGTESAFGLLGRLVFGRLAPGSAIHSQVQAELDRARRDLADAEDVI